MARVAIPITEITAAGVAEGAGTAADPTNDHYIDCSTVPLEELVIRFANTNGSDRVATIVAGDNPPADASGQGNKDITVPATTGVMYVGGLESARYIQNDSTVLIDLATSFAGTVRAFHLPRNA